jgi:hypothetical protein
MLLVRDMEIQRQVAEERSRVAKEQYRAAGAGLISELADAGFTVDWIYDLWEDGDKRLVPILLEWLPGSSIGCWPWTSF